MSEQRHIADSAEGASASNPTVDASRALRRAQRQAQRGLYAEAIGTLNAAMSLGADPYECYLRQARLYQSLGQWGDAVASAEKAIARKPHNVTARETIIALLIESHDFGRAVEAIRDLLRIAPDHVGARDALGTAYVGLGDLDAALRVINETIRLRPYDPIQRFRRGLIYEHKGEARLAIAEFSLVADLSEDEDLADSAREHLDDLDMAQLHDILLLAGDDPVFRTKLITNPEVAIAERGFGLSEWGLRRLAEFAAEGLTQYGGSGTPLTYH
ncbi:MAG: tetratricopeptide repeat protein [Chthonomonadales bacterium]|nr:tetratricopeptide repeat protein [Chthonomonadales bacterium]